MNVLRYRNDFPGIGGHAIKPCLLLWVLVPKRNELELGVSFMIFVFRFYMF